MPRYSRKEFIELCGIQHAYLTMNVKRNKVILNTNDEIDTSLQINHDFLTKQVAKLKKKALDASIEPDQEKEPENENKKIPQPNAPTPNAPKVKKRPKRKDDEEIEKEALASYNLDRYKKQLEIESLENSNKIAQIKLDKLNGVLIPTDLVMVLFGQHSKSLTTAFHQASENFVVEMSAAYGVKKVDTARMRGELITIVNKAIKDSLEISRSGINNIVDEYAINGK